jgi:ABC-type transport system involved in Fe-S cluster assembly fused permease/ATPase subunit
LIYVLCKFLGDLLNYFREIPFANMGAVAEISIAYDVYDHVQRQSLAFHLGRETGKIIRIVSRGSQQFTQIMRQIWFNFSPMMTELVLTLVVFGTLFSWEFVVLQLLAVVLYIYLTYRLTEWRASKFKKMAMADQSYNQKATDSLLNFETVKYFNAEAHEEQRFEKALNAYKRENIVVARSLVALNITQAFVIALSLGAILVLAYFFVEEGRMTIGTFVMFQQYNLQIYTPLGFLGTLWRWIRQAMVDVEQVLNLLEVDDKIYENPRAAKPDIRKAEIKFENVSFTYDSKLPEAEQRTVIDNISFTVPAGQSVGLVGQTGSGKSTIMRLLYRFYDIQEGRITIDGQDIKNMKIADLRSNIAIVPQDCVLFNDTIMYNIAYGGIREADIREMISDKAKDLDLIKRIVPAAKRAQIHKFVMEKQQGYWERVGERGLKLSGGEK